MKIKDIVKLKFVDTDDVFYRLEQYKRNGLPPGLSLGWPGFDQFYQVPPTGQLNVVSGWPGTGKSEWTDSIVSNMVLNHKWKVFLYSPENYPADYHIEKMTEKLIGKPYFSHYGNTERINDSEKCFAQDLIRDHLHFVNTEQNVACLDDLLNSIFGVIISFGCNMAVLDPWNKIEEQRPKDMNKTDFIGKCLTKIQLFARKYNISFWIVAHPAKSRKLSDGSFPKVHMYDIADSAHFYNMCDNGFLLTRDWNDKTDGRNLTHCQIAKIKDRRYGQVGEHTFLFQPWCGRFVDYKEDYNG